MTARIAGRHIGMIVLALAVLDGPAGRARAGGAPQTAGSYASMLGYLDDSRIDGHALAGASGAVAINLSAGDLNQQANLRSFAAGPQARSEVEASQAHLADRFDAPAHASASIGGAALANARGIVSINQASGSGNTELNAVAATLARQGIRETTDGSLSASVSASARGQAPTGPQGPGNGTRSVTVEAGAMRGFNGVLQLNQVAGSGNATSNQLLLVAPSTPR